MEIRRQEGGRKLNRVPTPDASRQDQSRHTKGENPTEGHRETPEESIEKVTKRTKHHGTPVDLGNFTMGASGIAVKCGSSGFFCQ